MAVSEHYLKEKRVELVHFMESTQAIQSESVSKAFLEVAREKFMPVELHAYAYQDTAYPIGLGQTISQPSTIATMLELLQLESGMTVLEVGSGSGYVLALLQKIARNKGKVFGVELVEALHKQSLENLKASGVADITVRNANGVKGFPGQQFDRILISAACPRIPNPLIEQLKDSGRLVAPVGDVYSQEMTVIKKEKGSITKLTPLSSMYAFVPLKGMDIDTSTLTPTA